MATTALRYALRLLVIGAVLLAGYTWVTLHWTYARGERAGYVQKLSRKGWLCKTWEGELLVVALPGTTPEKFFFTVPDVGVADKINQAMGKRVALTYDQHLGIPSSCFGDTGYFVTDIKVVD